MRKPATCPTCKTTVPVPRDAEPGDTITCAACDEVFTPTSLRKGNYDPSDEETFAVGAAAADPEKAQKSRKVHALMAHGRAQDRDRFKSAARPVFGGPEVFLLILAAVCAVALPLGFVIAKRFPTQGERAAIVFGYSLMIGGAGFRMIRARWRNEG